MATGSGTTFLLGWKYVAVAAGQTTATLSVNKGSRISKLIIQPTTGAPGNVILYDGKGANNATVYTYPGSATYDASLFPFEVDFDNLPNTGIGDTAAGWYVTTGNNVTVVAVVQGA